MLVSFANSETCACIPLRSVELGEFLSTPYMHRPYTLKGTTGSAVVGHLQALIVEFWLKAFSEFLLLKLNPEQACPPSGCWCSGGAVPCRRIPPGFRLMGPKPSTLNPKP